MSGSGGQSVLRQAVESLLRARAEAERSLEQVSAESADRVRRVAAVARAAGHPVARSVADEVAAAAPGVEREVAELTAATGTVLAREVHALLDLLAVNHHGLSSLPPLDVGPLSVPGGPLADAFPEGFARDYVGTVLSDLSSGHATSKPDAAAHPGADQAAIDTARSRILDTVAPEHRALVAEWLSHPDCHAVEVHGPQVSDRELELRAGWTRPPDHGTDGADKWRVRETDQKVISKHRAGAEATRFNTPESFARPLSVLLNHADQHPGGPDAFFDDHADDDAVAFFLPAESASLQPGDTFGHRGAGTGTSAAAGDWVQVRADAMRKDSECAPPVRTLAYDPVADGSDPGVRVVFRKATDGWIMTTYYPSAVPAPDNVRLEFPA